jgi:hypothetical protein
VNGCLSGWKREAGSWKLSEEGPFAILPHGKHHDWNASVSSMWLRHVRAFFDRRA